MSVFDEIATIPLINAAFLPLHPSTTSALPTATIFALRPSLLRFCLAQARAEPPLQRIRCIYSSAIAKSPGRSPDIVEYSRPLFHYPRHQRSRIASRMSSSDDDTPLVRAKDQGEFTLVTCDNKKRWFHAHRVLLSRDNLTLGPRSFPSAASTISAASPSSIYFSSITITLDPSFLRYLDHG